MSLLRNSKRLLILIVNHLGRNKAYETENYIESLYGTDHANYLKYIDNSEPISNLENELDTTFLKVKEMHKTLRLLMTAKLQNVRNDNTFLDNFKYTDYKSTLDMKDVVKRFKTFKIWCQKIKLLIKQIEKESFNLSAVILTNQIDGECDGKFNTEKKQLPKSLLVDECNEMSSELFEMLSQIGKTTHS